MIASTTKMTVRAAAAVKWSSTMLRSLVCILLFASASVAAERPNIVWIVWEDSSPNLGCYGDPDAVTPNLDAFAKSGIRFERCFTHAPVCAPSRSGLISGQYPTTLGSHHMRSKLVEPPAMWIDELKKAGYFTAWPGKTDFNFDVPKGWVDTVEDWSKKPNVLPTDKPFFAYINFTVSHESQARAGLQQYAKNTIRLKAEERRDPAKVTLPPYYPDTPAVRRTVANHFDNITAVDYLVGDVLAVLEKRGLGKNTIVFAFGDHGWGLPRGKRWPYDAGTRVRLLVRLPHGTDKGTVRTDLACFLDLGPTVLSLAGIEAAKPRPGRILFGPKREPAPAFVVSCRDRMDEAEDRVRSLRDERFRYVRNFRSELPYFQHINYLDEMPIMKDWRRLAFAGKLTDVQKQFWTRTKPKEELYDLAADPHEIKNLAADPAHAERLADFRTKLSAWIIETKDLGEVPERDLIARGLVKDVLSGEYGDRVKLHPPGSPVP